MAERRENSVLTSLKELRNIEDERIRAEQEARDAKAAAEKKAAEDAERQAREAAERKVREEADRLKREQEEKERQLREEQLRLESEKHRAEVEAKTRLEQARIQADMHVRAAQKKALPVKTIAGIVGGVVAAAGGVIAYLMLVVLPAREAEANRRAEAQVTEIQRQFKDAEARYEQSKNELQAKINATEDAAEREKLKADLARQEAQEAEARKQAVSLIKKVQRPAGQRPAAAAAKPAAKVKGPGCDPEKDPLCGSGL